MKQYARLDVSLKEISICVVDEVGTVRIRGSVACEPEAVVKFFAEKQTPYTDGPRKWSTLDMASAFPVRSGDGRDLY